MEVETLSSAESHADVQRSNSIVPGSAPVFSPTILNAGFVFALVLSAACFTFAAIYLYKYLNTTSTAVDLIIQEMSSQPGSMQLSLSARLAVAKYSLSSCGVVTGLAFGFLGFALFLLGIQGTMDAEGHAGQRSIQLARVAPGTFVITCAAVLIGISVTHTIDFSATTQYPSETPAQPTVYRTPEVGNDRIP